MFTFGRDHEKQCSADYVQDKAELPTIHRVIDAVHDLLESVTSPDFIAPIIADAFVNGGSGVWEQTGSWLAKLCRKYPELNYLWEPLHHILTPESAFEQRRIFAKCRTMYLSHFYQSCSATSPGTIA